MSWGLKRPHYKDAEVGFELEWQEGDLLMESSNPLNVVWLHFEEFGILKSILENFFHHGAKNPQMY